jgi:hypothetical protein
MGRHNQRDIVQAVSIENQALGTYLTGDDGAKFQQYPSNPSSPVIPTRTKIPDNSVGTGNPNERKGKAYYFDPIQMPYAMALNSTMAAKLARNLAGGTITTTTNTVPGTKDHLVECKHAGTAPMVMNVLQKNGGRNFLFGDVFVSQMNFTQQGSAEPQVSATLSNSGYHKKISDTSIDITDVVAIAAYLKYHGAKTKVTFSDGVDSYDLAGSHVQIDASCQLSQNVVVEQLPGDPFLSTTECQGAYAASVFIDSQSGNMTVKVYQGDTFPEFDSWLADRTLTSVKLMFASCEVIGATTHHAEFEIQFPKAEFTLAGDTNQNQDAFTWNIKAVEGDATTTSLYKFRIRQVGELDITL